VAARPGYRAGSVVSVSLPAAPPTHDEPHKYEIEHLNDAAREDLAAEQGYQEMLDHPESVVDAQDLF
jgi:hypothetical protein